MNENELWEEVKSAVSGLPEEDGAHILYVGVDPEPNKRTRNRVWIFEDHLERISDGARSVDKVDKVPRGHFWKYASEARGRGAEGFNITNRGPAPFGSFICSALSLIENFRYQPDPQDESRCQVLYCDLKS